MLEELSELGMDTEEAVRRCMGDRKLLQKLLLMFKNSVNKAGVSAAFEKGDYEKALNGAHALKGLTGNLSMKELYTGYCSVVELLRKHENGEAGKMFKNLLPLQNKFISTIEKYR